jgi:hypothetical protein
MAEKGFEPLSGQLGISGTSYRIQLGLINDKWASRILKGKDIIDSYVYKDVEGDFPNQNLIVGWVLRTIAIPNINPHQVMKTTQALCKQAVQKKEQRKMKPSISDSKDVELAKVPENELKRPTVKGWVKEEGVKSTLEMEEERRKAFKERMIAKKQEESAKSSATSTVKTTRQLPSIPSGDSPGVSSPVQKASDGATDETSKFCPFCGGNLDWKYCPYCGKSLPHQH